MLEQSLRKAERLAGRDKESAAAGALSVVFHCMWCPWPLFWGVFVLDQMLKNGAQSADKNRPCQLNTFAEQFP